MRKATLLALIGASLALSAAAAIPSPWTYGLALAAVLAASFGSLVYSYLVWKQETVQ